MNNLKFDALAVLIKLLGWVGILLLPIRSALVASGALVLADFFTGIWASYKEGKPITSHGMRRTIIKVLTYQSAIIVAFVLEKYLLDGVPVVKVVTGLIGVTEGKSFFENIHRITGLDIWNQVVSVLNLQDMKNQPNNNNNPQE